MLTCKEASALVSQSLDRRLGMRERVLLRVHLWACDACTLFRRQLEFLRAAARQYAQRSAAVESLRLSDAARERIKHTLGGN
jgi:Putative zinc-finger